RAQILASIQEQEKLTPELEKAIRAADTKQRLEDLYLPYKPKRRTRAMLAKEQGLEPLVLLLQTPDATIEQAEAWLAEFNTSQETAIPAEEVWQGARDILAETVAEDAELRERLRAWLFKEGKVTAQVTPEHKEKPGKFQDYYDFEERASRIAPHRFLAIRRGEKEKVLRMSVQASEDTALAWLRKRWEPKLAPALKEQWEPVWRDAWVRLLLPSLATDVRVTLKQQADDTSIELFAQNFRQLLLQSPGGGRVVLGLDPAFRTGTKWAVIDDTGRLLAHGVIHPIPPKAKEDEAKQTLHKLIDDHGVEIVAVGNGTASREVHQFVRNWLKEAGLTVQHLVVNESGASVYSASELARKEFPDLDLTRRSAISIARRYQDPLAEFVKIEPKSIGVGQYQHDVNQTRLKQSLDRTVESCVNFVGVDLNRASGPLLRYVSGITPALAQRIVEHRDAQGPFATRQGLLEVSGMGVKTFEQAAGFLRIPDSSEPLDASAVHPERYTLVQRMATDHEVSVPELLGNESVVARIDLAKYESDEVGAFTLQDILAELRKPGRDPRAEHSTVEFDESVQELTDLKPGMQLNGVVTNVTHFGAFVDIGVHQDGLVHVSELSDRFVKDPLEAIALGQQVKAWVLEVDQDRRRIALSLRSDPSTPKRPPKKSGQPKQAEQKKTRSEASDQRSGSPERSGQKTYSGKPRKPDKKAHPKSGKATSENRPEPSKATGDFQTDLAALMEKFNRN
ncbi:MAG: Tex family protein, partial [SAR324 cluster bacterium]|nr:Tex family protein [SAR324 cluster bacterium]